MVMTPCSSLPLVIICSLVAMMLFKPADQLPQTVGQQPRISEEFQVTLNSTLVSDVDERLWPEGIVPYTLTDEFTVDERVIIARAMREIQDKSCVKFVPVGNQNDYITIFSGNGCYSNIGRVKDKQTLSLQRNQCVTFPEVLHVLMHAIGFQEEHNRPDRDQYIRINIDNIEPETYLEKFTKYDESQYKVVGEYDTTSIMHAPANAFAKDSSIPVIEPLSSSEKQIGNAEGKLSPLDEQKLKIMYKC